MSSLRELIDPLDKLCARVNELLRIIAKPAPSTDPDELSL